MNTKLTFTDLEKTFNALLNEADKRSLNSGINLVSALLQTLYVFQSDFIDDGLLINNDGEGFRIFTAKYRLNKRKLKENVIESIMTLAQEKKDDKEYMERVEQSLFMRTSIILKYPNAKARAN